MRILLSILFIGFFLFTNGQPKISDKNIFEFRGVWVATVENIDWPSKRGLSNEDQKKEFIALLEMHKKNGMNAIVMQVRPSGDAMYPSTLEPWSEYLMGKQGLPPSPFYDPLAFMIQETHNRGMEFHAWINPYRAVFNVNRSSVAPSHVTKIHPEWFLVYGDKKYFNPGLPEVWKHTNRVVRDLVERYDIDAVHMDDYFYPYRIAGKEFPDQASFAKYGKGLSKDEWRRSNCDSIIVQLKKAILATNPRVKFGISPFGIWRNKTQDPRGSETKGGQTNYDDLYADILLWLQKGWIDYVVPQLYWERGHKLADYDVLLKWWNDYAYGKHLYIGHGIYRAGTNDAWKSKDQIPDQINLLRSFKTTQGSVFYNSSTFAKNPNGWNDSLQNNYYKYPALVPPMPWLDDTAPDAPSVQKKGTTNVVVNYTGKEKIKSFGIFSCAAGIKATAKNAQLLQVIMATKSSTIDIASVPHKKNEKLYVGSVDLNNNVSSLVELN
jgi:uncharacterized lipoprotein YddW (UPF0748 family)